MKRWCNKKSENIENIKIDDFLKDIIKVCVKHKLTISHEDSHGGFEIEKFNADNIDWLNNASDNT